MSRRGVMAVLAVMMLSLTACQTDPTVIDAGISLPGHSHLLEPVSNVVEHEQVGYCGNTVTTVRCERIGEREENREYSFMGGTSVSLTDFLRWLDYREGICRCLPEYYVKTEFSAQEYGIDLSEGYVRHGTGQVQLTEEQREYLRQTMEEIAAGEVEGLLMVCSLPLAEIPLYTE